MPSGYEKTHKDYVKELRAKFPYIKCLVGYSVETSPVRNKTITATWSAPCTQMAIYAGAFRRKVAGE